MAGKFYYDRKKKDTVVCLAGARSLLRPEKKRYSRLSGGCTIIITTGKKKIQSSVWRVVLLCQFLVLAGNWQFFVVAGNFHYDRKKKVPVGVSIFGFGGKLAVFLLWGESIITTGKKKIQSSVWRVRDHYNNRKKKFVTTGKKSSSRLSGGCVSFGQ